MNSPPTLHDLAEAFRPGIDSLDAEPWVALREALESDPQLRAQYAAIMQSDQRLRAALHAAPVPDGLAARLLERLAQATPAPTVAEASPPLLATMAQLAVAADSNPATSAAEPASERAGEPRRRSRRRWGLAIGSALSLGSIAALGWGLWPRHDATSKVVSREELAEDLQQWLADPGLRTSDGWSTSLDSRVVAEHSIDPAIQIPAARWRMLDNPRGGELVVYELKNRAGKTGYLFVSRTPRTYGVPTLPMEKWSLSGTRAAAAWQRSGLLFVLVVEQDGILIEDFVRRPRVA
jgi:hypothetical protein